MLLDRRATPNTSEGATKGLNTEPWADNNPHPNQTPEPPRAVTRPLTENATPPTSPTHRAPSAATATTQTGRAALRPPGWLEELDLRATSRLEPCPRRTVANHQITPVSPHWPWAICLRRSAGLLVIRAVSSFRPPAVIRTSTLRRRCRPIPTTSRPSWASVIRASLPGGDGCVATSSIRQKRRPASSSHQGDGDRKNRSCGLNSGSCFVMVANSLSARTSGAVARLAVVPAGWVCCRSCSLAAAGNVADSVCLIGSRVRRGAPEPTFRSAGSLLCLVTGWPLLKRPHVAVGVTEIRVEDAAHVLDVAQFDPPLRQSGPGRSHVRHDEMEAFD